MANNNYTVGCGIAAMIFVATCALFTLLVWGVKALYNATIPATFGGPCLSFWCVAGILLLIGIIGSFFTK